MAAGRPLFTLAMAGLLFASAGPTLADPLAVIASVKGRVDVTPVGSTSALRATFGRALGKGDRVSVAPGGAATVFFNDGNVIELSEKSAMTVGGRVAVKPKAGGPELPTEVYANVSKFVTGGSRETGLVAMSSMRSAGEVSAFLVTPRKTELLEGRPSFGWRAVEGATRYRVTLSGEEGERWTREAQKPALEFPADAAVLTAGDYLWEVRALSDKGEVAREESYFHVMTGEESADVRSNLDRIGASVGGANRPATHFLAGSYLFGRGLYRDAATHFLALAELSPDSSAPHEALGNVYRAVGLMDMAATEFQRALALANPDR
jgi:hypothetical protein